MKKKGLYISLGIMLTLLIVVLLGFSIPSGIGKNDITIQSEEIRFANLCQRHASVLIGTNQGRLYFMQTRANRSKYFNSLAVLEPRGIRITKRLPQTIFSLSQSSGEKKEGVIPIAISDGTLLYWSCYSIHEDRTLVSYDINTGKEQELLTVSSNTSGGAFFAPDGTFFVPAGTESTELYYPVSRGSVGEASEVPARRISFGGREYAVEGEVEEELVCYENGTRSALPVEYAEERTIIPTDYGLLIHNAGQEHLLYLVKESGEIQELFFIPCMCSDSAVNTYGDYAYLSVERFEDYDASDIGLKHYKNDKLQGTYKINLKDGSVKQLSNRIYDGLYIFDDSGIFACKDGNIVKLDFDGKVIDKVLTTSLWKRLFG